MTEKNSLYNNVFQRGACNLLLTWKCKDAKQFREFRVHIMPSHLFKIPTLHDNKKTNVVTNVYSKDW